MAASSRAWRHAAPAHVQPARARAPRTARSHLATRHSGNGPPGRRTDVPDRPRPDPDARRDPDRPGHPRADPVAADPERGLDRHDRDLPPARRRARLGRLSVPDQVAAALAHVRARGRRVRAPVPAGQDPRAGPPALRRPEPVPRLGRLAPDRALLGQLGDRDHDEDRHPAAPVALVHRERRRVPHGGVVGRARVSAAADPVGDRRAPVRGEAGAGVLRRTCRSGPARSRGRSPACTGSLRRTALRRRGLASPRAASPRARPRARPGRTAASARRPPAASPRAPASGRSAGRTRPAPR